MSSRAEDVLVGVTSGSPVVTPEQAALRGLDGADLRAACAAGLLVRVRRGAYVPAPAWERAGDAGRYRLRVQAAGQTLRRPVFSHDSAAVMWRMPRLGRWPREVHVSVRHDAGARSAGGVRRHAVPERPRHATVDGVRITGVERTVVDLARSWSFAGALVVADHAMRLTWATPDGLERELAPLLACRGSRAARRVLAAARPEAGSVGESLSRARMIELGLPAPALQHEVVDGDGLVGRVDFWWEHLGLAGEFDGRLKYRVDGVDDPRAVEERLWAEKQREDRLRRAGVAVVRWTWDDAWAPDRLATILRGAGLRP